LAPRALPRFLATMGLSDSPLPNARLMDSAHALSRFWRNRPAGSPSLPNQTFPARCPHSPRRSPPLLVNIASRRMAGFGISDRLADLSWRNEADSGSLALRLAGSIHGASAPRLLPALSASLHAGRSVGMMNTSQFIGLGWRCWRTGLRGWRGFPESIREIREPRGTRSPGGAASCPKGRGGGGEYWRMVKGRAALESAGKSVALNIMSVLIVLN